MSLKDSSKNSLPNISNPQVTYSQRYEHMTKLANYNEMNQLQIWKQYQKLRSCLKQLNEQVLFHMQKKAYKGIGKSEKPKISKDLQGSLILLQDEKKTNDLRLSNYTNQYNRLQQRIKYLVSKPNLLDQLYTQEIQLKSKIKLIKKQNKDMKRNAELQGRDLVNNTSLLDKISLQQSKLTRVFKQHKKHEQTLKLLNQKIQRFKQMIVDLQKAIDLRVQQFSRQQNYIQEQIHYQHYEELKKQKEAICKFQVIYKRNYLIKLKELQSVVNNINKHQKIIQQTQTSITNVRPQIDAIGSLIGAQRKRFFSSVTTIRKTQRLSQQKSRSQLQIQSGQLDNKKNAYGTANDKNQMAK